MDGAALRSARPRLGSAAPHPYSPHPHAQYRYSLHMVRSGPVADAGRDCEAAVFLDSYGNTAEQWRDEYGPYDDASVFLVVTEPGGEAVGCSRLVLPGPAGLKTLDDLARPPWQIDGLRSARAAGLEPERTWDVATIAVRRGAGRGGMIAAALYHGLHLATAANDARWIVMMMDVRPRRLLHALNVETSLLPGTRPGPYLGSAATAPLWVDLPAAADRQRAVDPDSHRLLALGIGLDGVAVPPREAFDLAAVGRADLLQPA